MIKRVPMVIAVGLVRRNPKLSPAEFKEYWLTTHVPVIKSRLPGLVLYTGSFLLPDSESREAPYDAVIELGFETMEAMQSALNNPTFLSQERQVSSAKFMLNADSMFVEKFTVEL